MEDTKNKNKKINSLSVSTLIIANLFPLGGVLFFGMDIVSVILLYWFESIVIGFFNVLKMIKIKGSLNSPYIPFFILQYVIFSSVHFYAILGILKLGWTTGEAQDIFLLISKYFNVIFFTLCTLIISHAFSFVSNFINKKEYLYKKLFQQMWAPYKRIIIMQVLVLAIVVVFIYTNLNTSMVALSVLIVLKILFDMRAHIREHNKVL